MGGHVAVTVRLSPQEEYRMTWGTNGLYLIRDREFLEQSGEYWAERLKAWRTNDELTGELAPFGYGFVLVDFVTRRILSLQGYTSVGRYNLVHLHNGPEDFDWLVDLIAHDKVQHVRALQRVNDPASPYGRRIDRRTFPLATYGDTPEKQVTQMLALFEHWFLGNRHQPPAPPSSDVHAAWQPEDVVMNFAPFSLMENQGTSHEEWVAAYQAVRDMGFVLSAEEEEQWQTWLAHYAPTEETDA